MWLARLRPSLAVVVAVLACVVAGAAAPGAQAPRGSKALTSAEECGRCHQDIYRGWKSSLHAQAADDARFQAAYTKLKEEGGRGNSQQICLRCHAPALLHDADTKWERKVSWEGVTCDFCHSVRSIGTDPKAPFLLDVGLVKAGPLHDAQPTTHQARYGEAFVSATLCNPCHQYTNEHGLDVLSTYAEWQASPYPTRGVTCQTCHMRGTTGKVVDPKVLRIASTTVNLHEMAGGHSVAELNRALLAQIAAERRGDTIDVTVQVTNRGGGHRVPTGSPLRSIYMLVQVDGGSRMQTANRMYGRVVVDENNQEVTDEAAVWLRGARTVRDDRLAPNERRVEKFSFQVPRGTPVRAVAKFYYRYAPESTKTTEGGMPFLSVSSWLDAGGK